MPRHQIDFPDDFFQEMLKRKNFQGQAIRWQVLTALRGFFGWDVDTMPVDGRLTIGSSVQPDGPKYGGQSPRSHPLDSNGWPIFSPDEVEQKKDEF